MIASKTYSTNAVSESGELEFSFLPQPDSQDERYRLTISSDLRSTAIFTSLFNPYPEGDALINGIPQPFDLTFRTYSRPPLIAWIIDFVQVDGERFLELIFVGVALLLPGVLLCLLLKLHVYDAIQWIALAAGIGLAIPPLLFPILNCLSLPINTVSLLSSVIVLAIATVIQRLKIASKRTHIEPPQYEKREVLLLGLMFFLAAVTRVVQIHSLYVPSWVDGIVHQEFMARIMERQYMPIDSIYPKGFHATVIYWSLLSGWALPESTLLIGQWLSLISGLTFYIFSRHYLKTPYALFSVCLYWFWSSFPSYLFNWGRYPFLQGLVLLPIAINLLQESILSSSRVYRVLFVIVTAAIGLTYYGTFLILIAYILVVLFDLLSSRGIKCAWNKISWLLVYSYPLLLLLGWRLFRSLAFGVHGQDSITSSFEDIRRVFEVSLLNGGWLPWILGYLGLIFMYTRVQVKFYFLVNWLFILLVFQIIQMSLGITISSSANIIIFLSIPLSLLGGLAIKQFLLCSGFRRQIGYFVGLIILAVGGTYNLSGNLEPSLVLFQKADFKAMRWIEENTPNSSVFTINSFLWGGDVAPSDGGGWIPFLANRSIFTKEPLTNSINSLCVQNHYVYVGNAYGDLEEDMRNNLQNYVLIYNSDGIRIYRYINEKSIQNMCQ